MNEHFSFFDDAPSRDELEHAIDHLFSGYTKSVCQSVLKVADTLKEFTAEDVRAWCEPPAGQENTFSAAMLDAKRIGIIKVTGYQNATRKEAKGRVIPIYTRGFKP